KVGELQDVITVDDKHLVDEPILSRVPVLQYSGQTKEGDVHLGAGDAEGREHLAAGDRDRRFIYSQYAVGGVDPDAPELAVGVLTIGIGVRGKRDRLIIDEEGT